ncbi:MAG: hypothetical protein ACU843_09855, partial [Gammaproteobacteria bacterium]
SIASTAWAAPPPALPEGNSGIAARYPNDVNIASDAEVLLTDGFESYTSPSQLTSSGNWDYFYHGENTSISTSTADVYAGRRALEFKLPITPNEVSNAVVKNFPAAQQDALFVRVYTKFEAGFSVPHGHNGIRISAGNYPGPGNIPNGSDFFLSTLENTIYSTEALPGYTEAYVYHPEQRDVWGDHFYPTGMVVPYDREPGDFGPYFVSRPQVLPMTDRWYCYEYMMQANTPGARDGRIAAWIDGALVADWQNLRLRDTSNIKINQIQLELHVHADSNLSRVNRKWYDNVVVATSYIGPTVSGVGTNPPEPPSDSGVGWRRPAWFWYLFSK